MQPNSWLPSSETVVGIARGLESLNPVSWIKNWGGGLLGAIVMLAICLILLCLVFRCVQQNFSRLMKNAALSAFLLIEKQKRGDMGKQVNMISP